MVQTRSGRQSSGATDKEVHVITGGGGYVGLNMTKKLLEKDVAIVLFDVKPPKEELGDNVTFVQGDIRNYEDVKKACANASIVYHLAAYGMSGREQLNKTLIEQVNVKGTQNVIKACQENGITRLVYTSTYNVVFGGQEIRDGDESLPYLPLDQHPDPYSRTKAIAEMSIMEANGTTVEGGEKLMTCALRLAGVYGPAEERHLPRIVSYLESGLMAFSYGSNPITDYLHIDNLVQAEILAGVALSEEKDHVAAGQAYFISDNKPINTFEFFRPLVEGLGFSGPFINLPLKLIYFIAIVMEFLHSIIGRVYNFQPLLTKTEVYKTGVTHYFSIKKAARDLGYSPTVQNRLDEVVEHFKTLGHGKKEKSPQSKFVRLFIDLIIAGIFASIVLSFLPITN